MKTRINNRKERKKKPSSFKRVSILVFIIDLFYFGGQRELQKGEVQTQECFLLFSVPKNSSHFGTSYKYFIPIYLDENNIFFVTAVMFRVNKLANVSD